MTGIGDLPRNDVEAAVAYVTSVLDEGRDMDADDGQTLLMLQDDPEELSAALRDLYAKRQARGLAAPARVVDLGRVRAALARLDRAVEQHPELATPEARERLAAWLEGPEPWEGPEPEPPPSVAALGNSAVVRWALRVSVLASDRARQAAAEAPAQKGGKAPRKA